MSKPLHVAVIGTGFAGLRCADILLQNGAQVTMFEARDRVGGRVHQRKVGDHLVDMGPNWIHGTGKNPIVAIAESTGTTIADLEGDPVLISHYGEIVGAELATKISDFLWSTIEEAFRYSNTHKDAIPPERSLLDFFKERADKTKFTPEEKKMLIETSRLWGAYVGDAIERQNNFFVASSYKNILENVSSMAIQHADIRFNQPIVKIESNPAGGLSTRHKITLTTAAGESSQFDEVVVTCPLGWLKRNKESAFTPELPARLIQAIDNISYGRLEKVYVTFSHAFWQTDSLKMTNGTGNHCKNHNHSSLSYPTFIQFLDPAYAEHPANILWNQECVSMAALPSACAHPTLLFYTYGPCATYIVSKLGSIDPSSEEYYTFLNNFLHPFYSRLPGYSQSSPHCTPIAFLATQWQNDPYAGNGSYCNFQVGLQQGDRDIETLRSAAGLGPDRGIWFAGEHTAPFVALGTTTGAYWSGERAAGQICSLYELGRIGMGLGRDDSLPSAAVGN